MLCILVFILCLFTQQPTHYYKIVELLFLVQATLIIESNYYNNNAAFI